MSKINEELAIEKGLIIDGDKSKYQELTKIYKYLLEYYINTKVDLAKYEELIKNSNLYIGVNDKYKSLNEYLNLNYIFLINNLFVEKLLIEDINTLTKFNKEDITDDMIDIIERTYKDVIYDNYLQNKYQNIVYKVCYGEAVPTNFTDNDSLVLKIYYGKNLIDLSDDEFIKIHNEQLVFFNGLINSIKKEFKEKLDVKCDILLEKDIY